MAHKTWTAEELDQMSPAEQQKLFDESIVRNLDDVPQEFLERIRAKVRRRSSETDTPKSA